jgi:hypothetical protein
MTGAMRLADALVKGGYHDDELDRRWSQDPVELTTLKVNTATSEQHFYYYFPGESTVKLVGTFPSANFAHELSFPKAPAQR